MSYQFEDDSALEELLNQQLDRRKQQAYSSGKQNRNSSRPTTGLGVRASQPAGAPSETSSAFRPSTASGLLHRQEPTSTAATPLGEADELASSLPSNSGGGGSGDDNATSRGRSLSSWLQGGKTRRDGEKVVASSLAPQRQVSASFAAAARASTTVAGLDEDLATGTNREVPRARFVSLANASSSSSAAAAAAAAAAGKGATTDDGLNDLLSPDSLQGMSKQRLIQVILEEVAPRLANQKSLADSEAAREVDRLQRELLLERNRLEIIEMRHGEQLKLEGQKWQQINQQLESRLAGQELQLGQLVERQREHLQQLNEQYQGQLTKLTETFDQRLDEERRRFEEILEGREKMHKLELEGKLNVNCDLMRLNTLQEEWRKMLEMTINQLSGQYKSVEALLDKQAIQVNGTSTELAAKAQTLCDQYDKYDRGQLQLVQLATEWSQLLPSVTQAHERGESLLDGLDAKLVNLSDRLNELAASQRQLEQSRMELGEMRDKMNEDKFKLALELSRVSMKEERLDELVKRNSAMELQLLDERKSVGELQTQTQCKRVALDEKLADLKEQNYALHLLRKRLTAQKEELLKAQLEFAEERKSSRGNKAQMEDEAKRLGTLRVRVQHELDQLRRLQCSLVCSLCMSRLFDGNVDGSKFTEMVDLHKQGDVLFHDQLAHDEHVVKSFGFVQSGKLPGASAERAGIALTTTRNGQLQPIQRTALVDHSMLIDNNEHGRDNVNAVNKIENEWKRNERERSRLADESRYVEQLFAGA